MTTRGVVPTGFSRKTLAEILSEIEQDNIDEFGAGVVQTSQSPLGQINGTFAEAAARIWELAEKVYQSFNPDEAEQINLDRVGRLRGVVRNGLADEAFRTAVTNKGTADIHLAPAVNAIRALTGVEYVKVFENALDYRDENGIDGHSLAFAVIGGDDGLVAHAIFDHTVAGIGLYGTTNRRVNDGEFCRTIRFLRPSVIEVTLAVVIADSSSDCEPPTVTEVQNAIYDTLHYSAAKGLVNGDEITLNDVMRAVGTLDGARLSSATVNFAENGTGVGSGFTYQVPFDKILEVDPARISVAYV